MLYFFLPAPPCFCDSAPPVSDFEAALVLPSRTDFDAAEAALLYVDFDAAFGATTTSTSRPTRSSRASNWPRDLLVLFGSSRR